VRPWATDADWQERYEALRSHALGRAPVAFVPLSLGILRRLGLAAWMVTATTNTPREYSAEGSVGLWQPVCDSGNCSELVQLLASLAVSNLEGECP
jgi:hypothetical protein